jgi:TRAP-type C4-dicarboxylate transport system permease small subunit
LRRFLDRLYSASGALAAVCLAGIAVVMLAQAAGREIGFLVRGADDIVAWLCAASAFLALGYTFRHGELVRVGLLLERLPPRMRRGAELGLLALAIVFTAYLTYAVVLFVYESWKFNELAQGLMQLPIWIPQMSLVLGSLVFLVALVDDFILLATGSQPAYLAAAERLRANKEFSDRL